MSERLKPACLPLLLCLLVATDVAAQSAFVEGGFAREIKRFSNEGGPVIQREDGSVFRAALQAVAARSDLVLVEGLVNVDENAHLVETTTWGRLYINILKWFSVHVP